MANISAERFARFREQGGFTQQQLGNLLGVTAKYVGMIERGEKMVGEQTPLGLLFRTTEAGGAGVQETPSRFPCGVSSGSSNARRIPVIGWADAGAAADYEEISKHWQSRIPTECPDEHAFAVSLEGDSMEPKFADGDMLVVQPGEQPYSGCFVLARFASGGIIFRRMEMSGDMIIVKPLNDRWPVSNHRPEDFSWIYPVWGCWTQIWRRR